MISCLHSTLIQELSYDARYFISFQISIKFFFYTKKTLINMNIIQVLFGK